MPPAIQLSTRRCHYHPEREAAARCPECTAFFCRECVTEHDDRVICSGCLRKLADAEKNQSLSWLSTLSAPGLALCGLIVAWLFFEILGAFLVRAPSTFHDGTIWSENL